MATSSSLLALLLESNPALVSHALSKLLSIVDTLWHKGAKCLPDLKAIAKDGKVDVALDASTDCNTAAMVPPVFLHLEESVQVLQLALESREEHFSVQAGKGSMYIEQLVYAAVEAYVKWWLVE
ncbi:hypothetical protein ACHAXS_001715 [Conticribra weissflogii]